eukprot:TRINITY_DN2300_c0_g1_i8.p2 TRINITY_DN2300_c0_g1~~TRINITY_DN2300_c0_g1_i8.p2  ORF type:complete len:187 (-),score=25.74 TRINITY_DN2300_c0_g1_i8:676-1236(-)
MDRYDKYRGNPNSFWYALKQQILKAWQPVPTVNSTIVVFFILSIFFLGFGILLLVMTLDIVEVSQRYDQDCQGKATCIVNLKVPKLMKSPVFVYYELDNFYQNHRRYMKSKDTNQLMGEDPGSGDIGDCDPVKTMADANKVTYAGGQPITEPGSAVANPCGLIARSMFNGKPQKNKKRTSLLFSLY